MDDPIIIYDVDSDTTFVASEEKIKEAQKRLNSIFEKEGILTSEEIHKIMYGEL